MPDHPSNIRKACLKAYLTRPEKVQVMALAKQARLTNSELVRRLVLGQKLPDIARHEAVLELINLRADLARLGNLFRMALADEDFLPPKPFNMKTLLTDIRSMKSIIEKKVAAL